MRRNITGFTEEKKRVFLRVLAETGNVSFAAQSCDISRTTVYQLREQDSEFAAAWDDSIEQAVDILEGEARRRALNGVDEPVFYQGYECGRIRKYSDNLLMFLIKGKRPEYATERREITGKDGGPLEFGSRLAEAIERADEARREHGSK